jgi:hypothetical protein
MTGDGFHWSVDWARIPPEHDAGFGSRTHGVAVLRDGSVAVLAQARPAFHLFASDGTLLEAWGDNLAGAHGLTLTEHDGTEALWITDQTSGEVSKRDLRGKVLCRIELPRAAVQPYSPTWVAVSPFDGNVWIADGYGSNVIYRFSAQHRFLGTLTGEEGPGRFARPHGIAFDAEGNAYVADRRNRRILRYDDKGNYATHVDDITHSPCGFAFGSGRIYVAELFGELTVLDDSLRKIGSYGRNSMVRPAGGWPHQTGWGWPELMGWPDDLPAENCAKNHFIAPHACAVAPSGTIYVVEWVRGGRITRLAPRADAAIQHNCLRSSNRHGVDGISLVEWKELTPIGVIEKADQPQHRNYEPRVAFGTVNSVGFLSLTRP